MPKNIVKYLFCILFIVLSICFSQSKTINLDSNLNKIKYTTFTNIIKTDNINQKNFDLKYKQQSNQNINNVTIQEEIDNNLDILFFIFIYIFITKSFFNHSLFTYYNKKLSILDNYILWIIYKSGIYITHH